MEFFASPFEHGLLESDNAALSLLEAALYLDLLMNNPHAQTRADMYARYLQWFEPLARLHDLQFMGLQQKRYIAQVLWLLLGRFGHAEEVAPSSARLDPGQIRPEELYLWQREQACGQWVLDLHAMVCSYGVDMQPFSFAASINNEFELWIAWRDLLLRIRTQEAEHGVEGLVDDFVDELQRGILLNGGLSIWLAVCLCRCSLEAVGHVPRMASVVHALSLAPLGCTPQDGPQSQFLVQQTIELCRSRFADQQPPEPQPHQEEHEQDPDQKDEKQGERQRDVLPKRKSGASRRKARRLKQASLARQS